jgi:hypothetical protein
LASRAQGWWSADRSTGWFRVANAEPAELDGTPDGQTAAAAEAAVATVSVPATAAIVSLLRFRVMIRRSRDKVTLQSIARGHARRVARLPSPWGCPAPHRRAAGRLLVDVARVKALDRIGGGPPSSRALTSTNHAAWIKGPRSLLDVI